MNTIVSQYSDKDQSNNVSNMVVQARLQVGAVNDPLEHEADSMADKVMRMPTNGLIQRKCSSCEEEDKAMRKPLASFIQKKGEQGGIRASESVSNPILNSRGKGNNLSGNTKGFMESRFGTEFSNVNIHTGREATQLSQNLGAKAFTVGNDIYFNSGQYAPNTSEGKRLLAHELTHVVQQGSQEKIQRQEIPQELMSSSYVQSMTEQELIDRYDLIVSTLLQFNKSTSETAILEEELGRIGIELGRRRALVLGRTFTTESIERMRVFFIANASLPTPQSCIATLNQGVRNLLDDQGQTMSSEIQTSMAALQSSGRISEQRIVEFNDTRDRITTGTRRPVTLSANIWDTMLAMINNDIGWSVFGLSLMDGRHSITLSLDNSDPQNPHVYWSDQWSSKGGWLEYTRTSLDTEITSLTQAWWDAQAVGRKQRTRVTLWRIIQ